MKRLVLVFLTLSMFVLTGCQESKIPVKILNEKEIKNIKEFETNDITLSEEKLKIYEEFALSGDENLLKNLSPMDIFKFYFHSYELQNYDVLYDFYMKGSSYDTPNKEDFLKSMLENNDRNNIFILNQFKENIKNMAQVLYNETTAYIQIRLNEEVESNKDLVWNFKLIKNQEGIWKVDWMPME